MTRQVIEAGTVANYITVTQVAHGFSVGDAIRDDGTGTWVLAQADDAQTTAHAVVATPETDTFNAVFNGLMNWPAHNLVVGAYYYLSSFVAGGLTPTPPSLPSVAVAMLQVLDADRVQVLSQGPLLAGGSSVVDYAETVPAATADGTWVEFMDVNAAVRSVGYRLEIAGRGNRSQVAAFDISAGINNGIDITMVSSSNRFNTGVAGGLRAVERTPAGTYSLQFLVGTTNATDVAVLLRARPYSAADAVTFKVFDYAPAAGTEVTRIDISAQEGGASFSSIPTVAPLVDYGANPTDNQIITHGWSGIRSARRRGASVPDFATTGNWVRFASLGRIGTGDVFFSGRRGNGTNWQFKLNFAVRPSSNGGSSIALKKVTEDTIASYISNARLVEDGSSIWLELQSADGGSMTNWDMSISGAWRDGFPAIEDAPALAPGTGTVRTTISMGENLVTGSNDRMFTTIQNGLSIPSNAHTTIAQFVGISDAMKGRELVMNVNLQLNASAGTRRFWFRTQNLTTNKNWFTVATSWTAFGGSNINMSLLVPLTTLFINPGDNALTVQIRSEDTNATVQNGTTGNSSILIV